MIGETIILCVPVLDPEEMSLVKLHAVETNGIWIESQNFTDAMMKKFQLSVGNDFGVVRSISEYRIHRWF
jgi:hypothetical protein